MSFPASIDLIASADGQLFAPDFPGLFATFSRFWRSDGHPPKIPERPRIGIHYSSGYTLFLSVAFMTQCFRIATKSRMASYLFDIKYFYFATCMASFRSCEEQPVPQLR